ncbi:hypothetical protein FKV68_10025 [Sinorhizobium mexicanum]|uniref:Uncharacterized protein n=1 Tax=Sinorhizobium mexicanum TaxID=375549 RepID=A0A859QIF9_9HYPH|nr:hypothetical protein FKV68_10025 [Sinorhizobium mexicanum]
MSGSACSPRYIPVQRVSDHGQTAAGEGLAPACAGNERAPQRIGLKIGIDFRKARCVDSKTYSVLCAS